MKVGDLVRTPRYGTYYLVVERRLDLRDAFIGHSLACPTILTMEREAFGVGQ